MDPRVTPANGRVAHVSLRGEVVAERFVEGEAKQVWGEPFLHSSPKGDRIRQLLHGDAVLALEVRTGWAFCISQKDGYCGYLPEAFLAAPSAPSHHVAARQTHLYPARDFKRAPLEALSMSARLTLADDDGTWARVETPVGQAFVARSHMRPVGDTGSDIVSFAEKFLGTPYVWAGNSACGIDCSGLVQVACLMTGIACPGDSDQQLGALGRTVPLGTVPERGDLLFWDEHVAIAAGEGRILHATAGYMSVVYENFESACRRILAAGDGPMIGHRRF